MPRAIVIAAALVLVASPALSAPQIHYRGARLHKDWRNWKPKGKSWGKFIVEGSKAKLALAGAVLSNTKRLGVTFLLPLRATADRLPSIGVHNALPTAWRARLRRAVWGHIAEPYRFARGNTPWWWGSEPLCLAASRRRRRG